MSLIHIAISMKPVCIELTNAHKAQSRRDHASPHRVTRMPKGVKYPKDEEKTVTEYAMVVSRLSFLIRYPMEALLCDCGHR